jgi:hypothetical protein
VSRWFLAAALLTGCGRFAFDDLTSDGSLALGDVGPLDAAPVNECVPGPVPDPLMISGQTFRYTDFDNTSAPVGAVMVRETFATNMQATLSDGNGNYSFGITTGGNAGALTMDIARGNYFTTHVSTDVLIGSHQAGTRGPVWTIGDAPIWDAGSMDAIYASAGVPYDAAFGTLNVAVRDCAGAPVEGVTVTLTPPPATMGKLFYQAKDGTAGNTAATTGTFTHAIALRMPPGLVTIRASGAGKTFADHTVMVLAGTNNTLTVIHGTD